MAIWAHSMKNPFPCRAAIFAVLGILQLMGNAGAGRGGELLPPGFRPAPIGVHALAGGKVVIKPGEVLEGGTIVIRDGLIESVGPEIPPPADARVWDMKGTTIYAGFIDAYLVLGSTNPPVTTTQTEPIDSASLTAGGVGFYGVAVQKAGGGPGYEVARVTPEYRAVKDYSPDEKSLGPLREQGFTAGILVPNRGILRGSSALVALADGNPNEAILKPDVFQHVAFDVRGPGTNASAYPGSLMGAIATVRQSFFDAQHYALDHADYRQKPEGRKPPEFDPAKEALAPAAERKMRVVFEPGSALMVDRAARLSRELGLDFLILSCGQEWRRPELAKQTGATFIVPMDFPTLPKLPTDDDWEQVQLDQLRSWDWAPENAAVLRRQGSEIALTTYRLNDKKKFRPNLRQALDRGLSESDALAALTTEPAKLCQAESLLGTIEAGKLANLTVVEGKGYFDPEAKVREVWVAGKIYRSPPEEPKPAKDEKRPPDAAASETGEASQENAATNKTERASAAADERKEKRKAQERELQKTRIAHSPQEDRGPLAEPKAVLIQNATVWTCGAQGRQEAADILVAEGKIKAVGKGLKAEDAGATQVVDGTGLHVTPGIIDCHSHTAILGGVNESTLPSTAMVRISDVVNSETENLHEQLAGGVTAVNLLHGSANPIGGQNCVIKLRLGASPEELVFAAAPPGIKFALGENVKQSNWGERATTRFPQTRMGVQTFIANRFTAAREYLAAMDKASKAGTLPPRRDLELEALGEIIQGKRWIHCHSYRQDEILMLLRLMESFGVKVGTLQHVLEGYKVADEIAKHGAGASTFSDWWAYKFEVYDAIPYNGSLMRDRGVVVSFNSDSSELARRLYSEAAKAVKYGNTTEEEALKFVTLNPARQLRIDAHVGSLEPGKDADFAIWSKAPLDSGTVCLQTWIEGRKYFDRALDAQRNARLVKEREDLVAKAKKLAKGGGSGQSDDSGESFFRVALEHQFDGRDRHCLDEEVGE
jgi:imidazolonepropionase-like amidohydrolase